MEESKGNEIVEGEDSLANRMFSGANDIPSAVIALPLLISARNMVWTEDMVTVGRSVVAMEAILCFSVSVYLRSLILTSPKRDEQVWAPTKAYTRATETSKPYVKVSMVDLEMSMLWDIQKTILIGLVVVVVVPYLFQVYQPILMQAVVIPLTFFRSKVFRKHALKVHYKNPYGVVSEKDAKLAETEASENAAREEAKKQVLANQPASVPLDDKEQLLTDKLETNILRIIKANSNDETRVATFAKQCLEEATKVDRVNFQTPGQGFTLLMAVSRHTSCVSLVNELIEHGAKVDLVDNDGWNALHWAAFYDNPACFDLLVKSCNDTQVLAAKTKDHSSIREIAVAQNASKELLDALSRHGI